MSETFALTCPNCAQIDRIQKVTSIVADGTKTTGSQTTKTDLAQKLSFKVTLPSTWEVNFPGAVFFTMLGGVLITGGWIGGATRIDGAGLDGSGVFLGMLFTVLGAPVASWGLYFLVNWLIHPALMRKRSQDKQIKYEQQALQYQKAQNAYNNLFYCYRCDGLFTKDSKFVPIEVAQELLVKGKVVLFSSEEVSEAASNDVASNQSEVVNNWPSVDSIPEKPPS